MKNQQEILAKLGIEKLNAMQEQSQEIIEKEKEVILLSPTGTGKTLAFLLPVIAGLNPEIEQVQALILVPSRELAIQIEQVIREMGSGYKANAVYGGRAGAKDKMELKHAPAILIGTPGRIADHMRRQTIDLRWIKTLVLDEFDKSLEVGFEKEMMEIYHSLPRIQKKILTSATQRVEIPDFMELRNPKRLDFVSDNKGELKILKVISEDPNKLQALVDLLGNVGDANGIIFCNFKETINAVSAFLTMHAVRHECFYGGLEQIDRERALIKFRNGSHQLLIATDLAARGIDVPELKFIIHFELPKKKEEFTHRNGRTARMHNDGTAYVLASKEERIPSFIADAEEVHFEPKKPEMKPLWETLYISGGRRDKISKGDIAGLFFKQGGLSKDELGIIELKQDCAFLSVPTVKAGILVDKLNNSRLKKKKVRITILD